MIHNDDSLFEVSYGLKCLENVLVSLYSRYQEKWNIEQLQLQNIIDEIHDNLTLIAIAYD